MGLKNTFCYAKSDEKLRADLHKIYTEGDRRDFNSMLRVFNPIECPN